MEHAVSSSSAQCVRRGIAAIAAVLSLAHCGGSDPAFTSAGPPGAIQIVDKVAQSAQSAPEVGGSYMLRSACSGKALDVDGASTADQAKVQIWTATGIAQQQFKLQDAGGGYVSIVAAHSNKPLDVKFGSAANGTSVWQYAANGSAAQQWRWVDVGGGAYKFVSRLDSSKVLDVSGAGTADGTPVQLWQDNGTCAQRWQLQPLSLPVTADLYVATTGSDTNPGSSSQPLRMIQRAVDLVKAGQTVLVRAGVYRERVITINKQGSESAPITFKGEPGAILDHSLRISSWVNDGGSVYKGMPDFSDPADRAQPEARKWSQMVVVNGQPLTRVYARGEVNREGRFYLDTASGVIYVWAFGGANLANATTLVINAKDSPAWYRPGLKLTANAGYIVFDGFVHRGGGIGVQAGDWNSPVFGRDLKLKNYTIEFNWQYALSFNSWDGATMDRCTVRHAGLSNWPRGRADRDDAGNLLADGVVWPHAIISWSGNNVTISNSRVHDNHGEGVGPYFDSSGWKILNNTVYDNWSVNIYIDTSDGNMLVDGNLVFNDPAKYRELKNDPQKRSRAESDGIRIGNEKADLDGNDPTPAVSNITITNNIVIGTGGGIMSFPYRSGSYLLKDSLIAFNTVVTSVNGSLGDVALAVTPGDNVRVINNIVQGNAMLLQGGSMVARNNLVPDTSRLRLSGGASASGTLFGAAQFTGGAAGEASSYRLQPGSPALGSGTVLTEVAKDFFGAQRRTLPPSDLGAIQAP